MMKDKQFKVAFVVMNKILIRFGLRITTRDGEQRLVFLLKIPDYDTNNGTKLNLAGKGVFVIDVTTDIDKAFEFLKIDKNIIERLDNIMHFTYYFIGNCPYLTLSVLKALEKELGESNHLYKGDPETKEGLEEFIHYANISELRPNEFDFYPLLVYSNLKERIVRNFFDDEEFDKRIISKKIEYKEDFNLSSKYSSLKLVNWLPELIDDPELAGNVSLAFINHVTDNNPSEFPSYLIDTTGIEIRREIETFYEYVYKHTPEYINHMVDGKNNENVL